MKYTRNDNMHVFVNSKLSVLTFSSLNTLLIRPEGDYQVLVARKARWVFQLQFAQKLEGAAAAASSTVPQWLAMGAAQVMWRSNFHGEAASSSRTTSSRPPRSSRKLPLLGLLP